MEYFWRINELGRIYDEDDAMPALDKCDKELTGEEFNPLTERNHYGQPNPF